jgi:site-specific DNA recombinase
VGFLGVYDGCKVLDDLKFIDNGYSGSNLNRPALEKLRDKISDGKIDKIYIHSPDRLSRKYAYQMVLLEEFQKYGVETIFLNHQNNESPESHLLLQMQGMIAEYERAKIMERNRRGKIHAAKSGSVNVLGGAPYGYRYINKHTGAGHAVYEIHAEESDVVRKIFSWVGHDRVSIGEVCRKLKNEKISSPKGKLFWDRSVIWAMLKNPAYKGFAAFGKTKAGTRLPRIRPQKHSSEQPKRNYSFLKVEKEKWLYVPVPAIIDEVLFEVVQDQLEENKKVARTRQSGASHLLQGLLVCQSCRYSCYGARTKKRTYYRCTGSDAHRFDGNKICSNKPIRADALETAVWEEVKFLLKNPSRIFDEYQRRILELDKSPLDESRLSLEKQENKLKRGIDRLIDGYMQEHIAKEEFEPRIKAMKQRLKIIENQKQQVIDTKKSKNELTLLVTNLEYFASNVESKLEDVDWLTKREIIRSVVKRVEIGFEEVNVVFRVKELPDHSKNSSGGGTDTGDVNYQHCCGGN